MTTTDTPKTANDKAMAALVKLLDSHNEDIRLAAALAILDRT